MEENITKPISYDLFGKLDSLEAGTFSTLSKIHHYLFVDIYYFAEEIREVNISKGKFRFVPIMYLEASLQNIKHLLKGALTDDINNREIYIKGIDASYHYEGYNTYTIKELIK